MKKLAFVGCAHIHAPAFTNWTNERKDSVEVAAVWDPNPELAAKYAEKLGSKAVASADEIWNDPSIEGVVITSETNLHGELVAKAAAAKKHMFVEKPIGFNAAEAKKMADAVEQAGVIFQTGYFMRGFSAFQFIKEQVEAGNFGKITRVRHCNCHSGSLGGWFDTDYRWMANPAIAGCGAFGDLGTHSLDILMWMFGKPQKVTGSIHVLTERYGKDCDEYGEASMLYSNGMIATIAAGWVDCLNPVVMEVCGTEGHAVFMCDQLYFTSQKVEGSDFSKPVENLPAPLPHAFNLFLDAFIDGKDVPLVNVQDAADRNLVMEAIYQGAKEDRWVTIG